MATAWDLLVRGGTLIDPAQSISAKRDVAFSSGKIRDGRRLSAAYADQL